MEDLRGACGRAFGACLLACLLTFLSKASSFCHINVVEDDALLDRYDPTPDDTSDAADLSDLPANLPDDAVLITAARVLDTIRLWLRLRS